jgi:protein-tyrosine phosphatase
MTQPDRHLPFDRAVNFRDLGGYPGADGRCTRWRCLFRSGHLGGFTDLDIDAFGRLGIKDVYDFRTPSERERAPSPHIPSHVVWHLDISPRQSHDAILDAWIQREIADEEVLRMQEEVYREIVTEHASHYREMFAGILASAGSPFLVHCMGGKDRTGIASALILTALGVEEKIIYQDYLETLRSRATILWVRKLTLEYLKTGELASDADVIERVFRLFGVTPERLTAALAAMKDLSGSVTDYLEQQVGLTAPDLVRLRDWYLQK